MNTVKISIDGKIIEAAQDATVLEAALSSGIYIPNLCYHPDLENYGGCRMCLVEIEGMRGLPTACTTKVAEGMKVRTYGTELDQARRDTLQLLLANHPLDCLSCVKNQNCELQQVAAYLGVTERTMKRTLPEQEVDDSNPFYKLDRNYCILCGRCTRTCNEITGVNAIEMIGRGDKTHVGLFGGQSFTESICRSCGECMVRCPVGALVPKNSIVPSSEVLTTCPHCGVGCSMYLGVRDGKVVSVRGNRDNPANHGQLCVKGRFGIADFVHYEDRLTTPLVRGENGLEPAAWDETLEMIAEKFKSYRPDEIAVVASARCTNEDVFVTQKLARAVMGTNNVDHCARLCHAPTVAGLAALFGSGAMTNTIDDLKDAACILNIGANTAEAHPIIGFAIKRAVKHGSKLIVINPRRVDLVRYADLWLRPSTGANVPLVMGMCRIILENNWQDDAFIAERCENFDEFKKSLEQYDLETVSRVTGVRADDIVAAARMYALNSPASITYAMGLCEFSHGTDNVMSVGNLAMLTGNLGKPGSGVNPLRGQNNVQGACDMGALPNVYPGYQAVSSPEIEEKFARAWGKSPGLKPGMTLPEMYDAACQGKIKAMYIVGENPMLGDPDLTHIEKALKNLEFLVVQDIFPTETASLAHVVLPGTSFAEKDGTFTNTERRVQRVRKAIEPVGDSRPDWLITCQIAQKMGAEGFDYADPAAIMDEISRLVPSFGGISFERLEACGGLQWPCPTPEHPGTPILHTKLFTRGRGKFMPLEHRLPLEMPDEEYPLLLDTGRTLFHYNTGAMTRRVRGLNKLMGEEKLQINPEDAGRMGIANGDMLKISSRRGSVQARALLTEVTPRGTVYMTFHFATTPSNVLVGQARDKVTATPEYKASAVRVEKVC
jgi:formate dehydrogenase alpha subunit